MNIFEVQNASTSIDYFQTTLKLSFIPFEKKLDIFRQLKLTIQSPNIGGTK